MLVATLLGFIVLIAIDRLWMFDVATRVRAHQFRLYAVRDKLRDAAMAGQVNPRNWVFQYLDSSITKTIDVLPRLNCWSIILVVLWHWGDKSIVVRQAHLKRELKKSSNAALAAIHLDYMSEIGYFIVNRHTTFRFPLIQVFRAVKAGQWIGGHARRVKELLTEAPETSTLADFVPSNSVPFRS